MRCEIESQIPTHRHPVEKVGLIQGADFPPHDPRMLRQLPKQPRPKWPRPRNERRLQRMHNPRPNQPLRNLVISIALFLGTQPTQPTRGHQHHLAILLRLHDVQQRAIALRPKHRVVFCTTRRHPSDKFHPRKLPPKPPQHFRIQPIIEFENVPGVRIQHHDQLHPIMLRRSHHPSNTRHKSLPIGLPIPKRQQGRRTQSRLPPVINQLLLSNPTPLRLLPFRLRPQLFPASNKLLHLHAPKRFLIAFNSTASPRSL